MEVRWKQRGCCLESHREPTVSPSVSSTTLPWFEIFLDFLEALNNGVLRSDVRFQF